MMATCFAVRASAADGKAVSDSADLYISFDEKIKDDAGKHTVTVGGSVPLVEGHAGTGGHFVAYASDLNAPNYLTIEDLTLGTSSFTFSYWIYTTAYHETLPIFGNKSWDDSDGAKNPGIVWVARPKGDFRFYSQVDFEGADRHDVQWWRSDEVNAILYNTWYMVTVVVDRDNYTMQMYHNGVLAQEVEDWLYYGHKDVTYDVEGNKYRIFQDGNLPSGDYPGYAFDFDQVMDEFYLWKRALTADEVAALYTYVPVVESESQTDADTTINEDVNSGDAPQTFDFAVIAAVAAIVSAAGYAISKKR